MSRLMSKPFSVSTSWYVLLSREIPQSFDVSIDFVVLSTLKFPLRQCSTLYLSMDCSPCTLYLSVLAVILLLLVRLFALVAADARFPLQFLQWQLYVRHFSQNSSTFVEIISHILLSLNSPISVHHGGLGLTLQNTSSKLDFVD